MTSRRSPTWVNRGGTFITFEQTGRHTSTQHDVWPIAALTGYDVIAVERKGRDLKLAAGQTVLPDNALKAVPNNWGLTLKKHAADDTSCQDVALWDDGTVAAGVRKIGKGLVIDFGMFDSCRSSRRRSTKWGSSMFPGIWPTTRSIMRHFVSNNGLYDVWTMWNQQKSARKTDLVIDEGQPHRHRDGREHRRKATRRRGQTTPAPKVADLAFEPLQTRVLLTPTSHLAGAPAEWFWLQRGWWRGTADAGPPMASYKPTIALDLTDDNAFHILPGDGTTTPPEDPHDFRPQDR